MENYTIEDLDGLIQLENENTFSEDEVELCLQHEVCITTGYSNRPIVGTAGAAPCLILAMYNPSQKIASISHIDGHSDVKTTYAMLKDTLENCDEHIEVHLAGAAKGSEAIVNETLDMLNDLRNQGYPLYIYTADVLNKPSKDKKLSHQLAIDARTGEVSNSFNTGAFRMHHNYRARMSSLSSVFSNRAITPLFLGYNGKTDIDPVKLEEAQADFAGKTAPDYIQCKI